MTTTTPTSTRTTMRTTMPPPTAAPIEDNTDVPSIFGLASNWAGDAAYVLARGAHLALKSAHLAQKGAFLTIGAVADRVGLRNIN